MLMFVSCDNTSKSSNVQYLKVLQRPVVSQVCYFPLLFFDFMSLWGMYLVFVCGHATIQQFNAGGGFGQGHQRVGRREGLQVASRSEVPELGCRPGGRERK